MNTEKDMSEQLKAGAEAMDIFKGMPENPTPKTIFVNSFTLVGMKCWGLPYPEPGEGLMDIDESLANGKTRVVWPEGTATSVSNG